MNDKRRVIGVIGFLSGCLSLFFGITTMCMKFTFVYEYTSDEQYGGDAYTGIQNACSTTANNTYKLGRNIQHLLSYGIGGLFIVLGIAICCYFCMKLVQSPEKQQ